MEASWLNLLTKSLIAAADIPDGHGMDAVLGLVRVRVRRGALPNGSNNQLDVVVFEELLILRIQPAPDPNVAAIIEGIGEAGGTLGGALGHGWKAAWLTAEKQAWLTAEADWQLCARLLTVPS